MKTKILAIIAVLGLVNLSFISNSDLKSKCYFEDTIIGTYDGNYSGSYNFLVTEEDDYEEIMSFENIEESVLSSFKLKDKSLIGTKFEITYRTETIIEEDEDGDEQEFEVYTIMNLKKL